MRATDRTFGAVTVLIGEKNGKYPDGNSVLVRGRDATLLIDPSLSVAARAAELPRIDHVVQSHVHEDHLAGLFRFPHAAVHAHRHDVLGLHSLNGLMAIYGSDGASGDALQEYVESKFNYAARADAQPYDDGAVFDLGGASVRAIHLPGHTRGHCALFAEPDDVLYLGDIDLTGFGPYYGDAWSCLEDFERSLARVRDLPARAWVSFHHVGVLTERSEFLAKLDRFAGRIAEREQAMLDFLAEPHSLDDMVAHRFLYPPHAQLSYIDGAERRTAAQHLDRLLQQGRIRSCGDGRWVSKSETIGGARA
jgi:glyoxylase-like metal-dependent hydrolase (beta-lactamase superfamily II)